MRVATIGAQPVHSARAPVTPRAKAQIAAPASFSNGMAAILLRARTASASAIVVRVGDTATHPIDDVPHDESEDEWHQPAQETGQCATRSDPQCERAEHEGAVALSERS